MCRAYLNQVIGLGTDQKANAVRNEGIEFLDNFCNFEKEDIKTLCRSVRRPGDTIVNPVYNPAAAVPSVPAVLPNPGYNIPAICETRLVNACYVARTQHMIGRNITRNSLSRTVLTAFSEHRTIIEAHKDPEKIPTISKSFTIAKALDVLPRFLREKMGGERCGIIVRN